MGLLVDYKCRSCSGRAEHWTIQPIPASQPCAACGGEARRLFAVARVSTGDSSAQQQRTSTGRDDAIACLQNSRAPGACHMHPSAARRWSAMGRGDTKAVEHEIEYQEKAIRTGALTPSEAFTHSHAPVRTAGSGAVPSKGARQHTAGES